MNSKRACKSPYRYHQFTARAFSSGFDEKSVPAKRRPRHPSAKKAELNGPALARGESRNQSGGSDATAQDGQTEDGRTGKIVVVPPVRSGPKELAAFHEQQLEREAPGGRRKPGARLN